MNVLHYAIFAVVVLVFITKLTYHLFYEIPRDKKVIERRSGQER